MSVASRQSSGAASQSIAAGSSSDRPQPTHAERTADARKAFLSSLGVAAKEIDNDLQSRGKTIHSNAQALNKQEKQVLDDTKKLAKQNQEMEKWLQKSQKKLEEFDEVMDLNTDGLEDDLDDLEAMLDSMEKGKSEEDATVPEEGPSRATGK